MQKSTRITAAFALAIVAFAAAANSFAQPLPKSQPMPKYPTDLHLISNAVPAPKTQPMPKYPTDLR